MGSQLRRSGRKRNNVDYGNLNDGIVSLAVDTFRSKLASKLFIEPYSQANYPQCVDKFPVFETGVDWYKGLCLKEPWNSNQDGIQYRKQPFQGGSCFTKYPVLIKNPDGLGMKMPTKNELTVETICKLCGEDRILSAMDVSSQKEKKISLGDWVTYFNTEASKREHILNVLSLEISDTDLGKQIRRPDFIESQDWVTWGWPDFLKNDLNHYPKVQKYCLMSVEQSYTDFHIDFAGTSVFYHLVKGRKLFYFVEPTLKNLKEFESWSRDTNQNSIFFPDILPGGCSKNCYKFELNEGDTMFIPSGWIHAVFTPKDSLVIGGNFLINSSIQMQTYIQNLEARTEVQPRFRYPFFDQLCWYVAKEIILKTYQDYETQNSINKNSISNISSQSNSNISFDDLPTYEFIDNQQKFYTVNKKDFILPCKEELLNLINYLKQNLKYNGRKGASVPIKWKDFNLFFEILDLLCGKSIDYPTLYNDNKTNINNFNASNDTKTNIENKIDSNISIIGHSINYINQHPTNKIMSSSIENNTRIAYIPKNDEITSSTINESINFVGDNYLAKHDITDIKTDDIHNSQCSSGIINFVNNDLNKKRQLETSDFNEKDNVNEVISKRIMLEDNAKVDSIKCKEKDIDNLKSMICYGIPLNIKETYDTLLFKNKPIPWDGFVKEKYHYLNKLTPAFVPLITEDITSTESDI